MKSKNDKAQTVVANILFVPLAMLMWRWYSHVWFPHPLGWWLCLMIGFVQALFVAWGGNLVRMVFVIILISSLLMQIASWGGAFQLPVIKQKVMASAPYLKLVPVQSHADSVVSNIVVTIYEKP